VWVLSCLLMNLEAVKDFPTFSKFMWHFSIFLILMWLVSTVSRERQTQRWMPKEDFFTHISFTWFYSSMNIMVHNMIWGMAGHYHTEYLL
jgi:hypothetical protein